MKEILPDRVRFERAGASFIVVDTTTGAVLHVYERAGGLKYGEVEVGQETVVFESEASDRDGEEEKTL